MRRPGSCLRGNLSPRCARWVAGDPGFRANVTMIATRRGYHKVTDVNPHELLRTAPRRISGRAENLSAHTEHQYALRAQARYSAGGRVRARGAGAGGSAELLADRGRRQSACVWRVDGGSGQA